MFEMAAESGKVTDADINILEKSKMNIIYLKENKLGIFLHQQDVCTI